MYNRYIPQNDGGFQRTSMPDHAPAVHAPPPVNAPPPACPPASGFSLKNLLPADFDTEDLLVILLLLTISADCRRDRTTTLLTLVIYLFS